MRPLRIRRAEDALEPVGDGKSAAAGGGMVSTASPHATAAGVRVLAAGGNAVDAAVAAALALGVAEPQASGLGGQGSAILHLAGRTVTLDGSSRAPSLAHIGSFGKGERSNGYRAATIPGTPALLGYMHLRYGRLPWADVVEPSIRLARDGYEVTSLQHALQERERPNFERVPSGSGARYFLNGGKPYAVGARFVQKDLAALHETLASEGFKAFYHGEVADTIDKDMRANGGFLRKDDLAQVPWPVERPALERRYRRLKVVTLPPPAAGRTLLLVLMMLTQVHAKVIREQGTAAYHRMAETFRKALLTRVERPFDPATYPQFGMPTIRWSAAKRMAASIGERVDPALPRAEPPLEAADTTHLSVMDRDGNAVGLTQSIERVYGSRAAADGLGFLYNNYMLAYDTSNPAHPYYLRPGAVPWSSVAPSLVFHKERLWMVMGSPGSERIPPTLAQFLSHIVDRGLSVDAAMRAPRLHCSIAGRLSLEADRFDPAVVDGLAGLGYEIDRREPYAFYLGAVHAVVRRAYGDGFQGVAEVRRDGTAAGPAD